MLGSYVSPASHEASRSNACKHKANVYQVVISKTKPTTSKRCSELARLDRPTACRGHVVAPSRSLSTSAVPR